jgi:uncharacterized protein YqgV (UPF0045/DUF77 family)
MHIAVEISLYPLADEFIPAIKDFIERINHHPDLRVVTNAMSTQVSGDLEKVMPALQREMATTFRGAGRKVFVMKVLGGGD